MQPLTGCQCPNDMSSVAEIFESLEYGPAPESDKEALSWLAKHERVFGHFIGGHWTEPGETFDVSNPATRALLARVSQGTASNVNAAGAPARTPPAPVRGGPPPPPSAGAGVRPRGVPESPP